MSKSERATNSDFARQRAALVNTLLAAGRLLIKHAEAHGGIRGAGVALAAIVFLVLALVAPSKQSQPKPSG